ncbi:MAG: glycosyltransferase family 2 protein [Planctomycetes bacterium]|nr:glycosyltransferase family 2 protein [Planctomycetota bacterium]
MAPVQTEVIADADRSTADHGGRTPDRASRTKLVTIVLPVLNEAENLRALLIELDDVLARIEGFEFEILVVDDGSTDGSSEIAMTHGARVHRHPRNLGNGAAVKRGIREARGDYILLMDGDGQHPPDAIPRLLSKLGDHDLVVGSRGGSGGSLHRNLANRIYNRAASYVTQAKIPDLTSGFRVARADFLKSFVHMLPNTFSYPTTITLAAFRAGYSVHYEPISVRKRGGRSKIRLFEDGSRFFLIILKVATLVSPLRVFLPLSFFVGFIGLAWYFYSYFATGRFTNMAVLLLVQATVIFSLGLISEQVAQLRFEGAASREGAQREERG